MGLQRAELGGELGNHSWEQSDMRMHRVVVMGQEREAWPHSLSEKTNPQNLPVSWSEMENGGKRGRWPPWFLPFANSLLGNVKPRQD